MAGKKEVLRKCVSCGERKDRRELIRVVRTPEGEIKTDLTGKMNGRGAYICRTKACLERAKKTHALDRSLGVKIGEEALKSLEKEIEEITSDERSQ